MGLLQVEMSELLKSLVRPVCKCLSKSSVWTKLAELKLHEVRVHGELQTVSKFDEFSLNF